MGAFGSCLGVGRPIRPGANPRLLASNLVNVDGTNGLRGPPGAGPLRAPGSYSRDAASVAMNGRSPMQKGRLANGSQLMPFNHGSPQTQTTITKLVDIDDNVPIQNSHSICNRNSNNSIETPDDESLFVQELRANPNDCKVLLAIFDYEPRTKDDLGFQKGEHLETLVKWTTGEWWLARSKSTKRIGYVPCNYVVELKSLNAAPWYFDNIRRVDAEALLRMPENRDGAYIIRVSQTGGPSQYSLSLKHENVVKHYKIVPFEAGGFYINKRKIFSTLHDLVQHYSQAPDGLCINLREPCKKNFETPATIGLSYDTYDRWEIDRNRLKLLHEIGRGQFGQVYEGLFDGNTRVAIKTLKKNSMDPQDFLAEAQIMKKMNHRHLVRLFAVCTKLEPVYIVTELMSKGALNNYLTTDEGKNLPLTELISMATQIADGMSFLEKERYVHRDLAARNILVGDKNVCKIADFGLARFIKETEYEAHVGARFPIKWTAPEAANFSRFTIKSDVWSFGIVLYEIITRGGNPYPDMTNAEVLDRIGKGYRMPQPPYCEPKYYGIMVECWHKDPIKRPTFDTLHWKLDNYFCPDEQYREASQYRDQA